MSYRKFEIWQLARELTVGVHNTGSLSDATLYHDLRERLDVLGGKLNRFIQGVESSHRGVSEESPDYTVNS